MKDAITVVKHTLCTEQFNLKSTYRYDILGWILTRMDFVAHWALHGFGQVHDKNKTKT